MMNELWQTVIKEILQESQYAEPTINYLQTTYSHQVLFSDYRALKNKAILSDREKEILQMIKAYCIENKHLYPEIFEFAELENL